MAAGRLCSQSYFFAFSVLGLLAVCFHHDVEASVEKSIIHKKVGETVEFESHSPTEGVTVAEWRYGGVKIATIKGIVNENQQFKDRIHLILQNYSLIVTDLTLQDSGDYMFVSEVNGEQRPTVTIELRVHEPITEEPLVSVTSVTRDSFNRSCLVILECNTSVRNVNYTWTVGSRTETGSKLQHIIRPQDGEITFICTISNHFDKKSSSVIQNCDNGTFPDEPFTAEHGSGQLVLYVAGGGCLLILVVVVTVMAVYCFKRREADDHIYDQTVYDCISDDKTMKPSSVYETVATVSTVTTPVTPAVHTVYDKIQLHHVGPDVMSHYQEVC